MDLYLGVAAAMLTTVSLSPHLGIIQGSLHLIQATRARGMDHYLVLFAISGANNDPCQAVAVVKDVLPRLAGLDIRNVNHRCCFALGLQ